MDAIGTEIPALGAASLVRNREQIKLSADPAIPFFRSIWFHADKDALVLIGHFSAARSAINRSRFFWLPVRFSRTRERSGYFHSNILCFSLKSGVV